VNGGVPAHVPVLALSVWPSVAVPVIAGAAVLDGASAAMTPVGSEAIEAEPAELLAVIVTRNVVPASAWPRL